MPTEKYRAPRGSRHPRWGLVAAAVAGTLAVVLLAVNFMTGEKKIQHRLARMYSVADPQFALELSSLLGPPLVDGNRIAALRNGDEIFPTMLDAIRSARQSVNFESYIYWSGNIGKQFAEALSERARHGVQVHVLLDWVGSAKMDGALLDQLKQAGVQVYRYHPPSWYDIGRLNNRTHRKLLIVDGRIGFTGGIGIAPAWTGDAQDADHWRDTHFKVEGPGSPAPTYECVARKPRVTLKVTRTVHRLARFDCCQLPMRAVGREAATPPFRCVPRCVPQPCVPAAGQREASRVVRRASVSNRCSSCDRSL